MSDEISKAMLESISLGAEKVATETALDASPLTHAVNRILSFALTDMDKKLAVANAALEKAQMNPSAQCSNTRYFRMQCTMDALLRSINSAIDRGRRVRRIEWVLPAVTEGDSFGGWVLHYEELLTEPVQKWWEANKSYRYWSSAINNVSWDDLWEEARAEVSELFKSARQL